LTNLVEPAKANIVEENVMKNSLQKKMMAGIAAAGLAAALIAAGCSTTVQSAPEAAKAVESGGPLLSSVTGFLGPDASKLAPGPEGGAALVWINPNARWSSYTKIQLVPVEFWAAADSKVSTADQQTLTTYFYNALQTDLSKSYTLVDQPGPGVMTLRVALMDATTAVPGLRTVSVVIPQLRVINAAQSLATDSYAFVGSAEAEMKLTDSVTGALLAEAVDQRAGGMGIKSAASFRWGDAQNAMDYWAEKATSRLLQLQGKPAQS
jgi:Protein of unknown function (DUF3313)